MNVETFNKNIHLVLCGFNTFCYLVVIGNILQKISQWANDFRIFFCSGQLKRTKKSRPQMQEELIYSKNDWFAYQVSFVNLIPFSFILVNCFMLYAPLNALRTILHHYNYNFEQLASTKWLAFKNCTHSSNTNYKSNANWETAFIITNLKCSRCI